MEHNHNIKLSGDVHATKNVRACVRAHARMFLPACLSVSLREYVQMRVSMCASMHMRARACVFVRSCVRACVCACVRACGPLKTPKLFTRYRISFLWGAWLTHLVQTQPQLAKGACLAQS